MGNITFSLDDELLTAAKVLAAAHSTSVNALVRSALEHQVALGGSVAEPGRTSGVVQALVGYSIGRLPRAAAMATLGIDDYGALLRLLNAAGLPHPLVPMGQRKAMAAQVAKALFEIDGGVKGRGKGGGRT